MGVFQPTGTKCYYCGDPLVHGKLQHGERPPDNFRTRDHRVPKSKGGKGIRFNQVDCCTLCNVAKDSLTEAQFVQRGGRFV